MVIAIWSGPKRDAVLLTGAVVGVVIVSIPPFDWFMNGG